MAAGEPDVTGTALARIIEVRRPIRPELPPEGLIALTPNLVLIGILLAFLIGAAVVVTRTAQYYYPFYTPAFRQGPGFR